MFNCSPASTLVFFQVQLRCKRTYNCVTLNPIHTHLLLSLHLTSSLRLSIREFNYRLPLPLSTRDSPVPGSKFLTWWSFVSVSTVSVIDFSFHSISHFLRLCFRSAFIFHKSLSCPASHPWFSSAVHSHVPAVDWHFQFHRLCSPAFAHIFLFSNSSLEFSACCVSFLPLHLLFFTCFLLLWQHWSLTWFHYFSQTQFVALLTSSANKISNFLL